MHSLPVNEGYIDSEPSYSSEIVNAYSVLFQREY